MSAVSPEFAMRYSRAWAEHDPDAILALHTDDTVFQMHGYADPATGTAAAKDSITALFEQSPDLRFESRRLHFGEDHFVSEYVVSGTVEGRPFACDGVDVITMRDGRVARKDSYIDWLGFQRQVGVDLSAIAGA
jgi:ketosteroid isomerase-like protein